MTVSLTQSQEGRLRGPLLTEGQELLWQHGVRAQRVGAGLESRALLSRHGSALSELLEPADSFQGERQSIFLEEKTVNADHQNTSSSLQLVHRPEGNAPQTSRKCHYLGRQAHQEPISHTNPKETHSLPPARRRRSTPAPGPGGRR